jgi:hypothetical protein
VATTETTDALVARLRDDAMEAEAGDAPSVALLPRDVIRLLDARDALRDDLALANADADQLVRERDALRADRARVTQERNAAEQALRRYGYRHSCDIPACNRGDQWGHGTVTQRLDELTAQRDAAVAVVEAARMLDTVRQHLPHDHWRRARLREAVAAYDAALAAATAGASEPA